MRRLVIVAALACCALGSRCTKDRERPRAPAAPPAARNPARLTGPWVRVAGSVRRDELDTTSIVRTGTSVYQGWYRRPLATAEGAGGSYRVRYEIDCLAGLVRATQAAIHDSAGRRRQTLGPADLLRSGEARWSGAQFRDLGVVARALCDRVRDVDLPITDARRP